MGKKLVHFILVLSFASLPAVRSECRLQGAVLSEGSCFLYNETLLSFSDANAVCKSQGGVLAKLTSRNQLLEATEQTISGDIFWIGAKYDTVKGNWIWEYDNTVAAELSQFWGASHQDQECAQFYVKSATEKELYDLKCSEQYAFLCMFDDLNTTQDTTLKTLKQTSLVTSAVESFMTTVNTTTETNTNAILSSTPTSKVPITTLMNSGENFIKFTIPLLLNLCLLMLS
ncbi:unnamed protein product [Lymnaea stagnalis]|uniref:C-type lectin domain-containing protein n=1 Tax=Lymnaea stagnalis TaxID=6523 RepID=A0AAV2H9I1_LYMST